MEKGIIGKKKSWIEGQCSKKKKIKKNWKKKKIMREGGEGK